MSTAFDFCQSHPFGNATLCHKKKKPAFKKIILWFTRIWDETSETSNINDKWSEKHQMIITIIGIFMTNEKEGNIPIGSHVNMILSRHESDLLSIQPSEREHPNLLNDVAPVTRSTWWTKLTIKCIEIYIYKIYICRIVSASQYPITSSYDTIPPKTLQPPREN